MNVNCEKAWTCFCRICVSNPHKKFQTDFSVPYLMFSLFEFDSQTEALTPAASHSVTYVNEKH